MNIFAYVLNVVFARSESALGKYNAKVGGDTPTFNSAKSGAAALISGTVALILGLSFDALTLGYSVLYGAALALSMHAGVTALSLGNMGIVSMIASFSLVVPTLWGIAVLGEQLGITGYVGLLLLVLSIVLLNVKKGSGRLSLKCWIYSLLTLLSNGIASVVQKQHQVVYSGEYKTEFMLYAMVIAALIFTVMGIVKNRGQRSGEKKINYRPSLIFGAMAGVLNYLANYTVLMLATVEDASVMFPVLSAGNAVGACLVGRIVFKERLTVLQMISILFGILSVVLLKI